MVKVEVRMLKLDLIFITWNGIFVLPFMGCQSMAVFTSMEWGTLRVKCLTQEHNTITLTGWENDISWCYLWFPLELTSEKGRNSKLMLCHYPDLGICACDCLFSLVAWPTVSNNQMQCPDLCSDTLRVWNICAHSSDIITRGSQWQHWDLLAVLWLWQGWKQGFFILRLKHGTLSLLLSPCNFLSWC